MLCRLLMHFVRLAASRTFWTAGTSRPIKMAMMAMTTSNSIRVKPDRRNVRDMVLPPFLKKGPVHEVKRKTLEQPASQNGLAMFPPQTHPERSRCADFSCRLSASEARHTLVAQHCSSARVPSLWSLGSFKTFSRIYTEHSGEATTFPVFLHRIRINGI